VEGDVHVNFTLIRLPIHEACVPVTVKVKLSQFPIVPACVSTHVGSPFPAGGDPVKVPTQDPVKGTTGPVDAMLPAAGLAAWVMPAWKAAAEPRHKITDTQMTLRNWCQLSFDFTFLLFI